MKAQSNVNFKVLKLHQLLQVKRFGVELAEKLDRKKSKQLLLTGYFVEFFLFRVTILKYSQQAEQHHLVMLVEVMCPSMALCSMWERDSRYLCWESSSHYLKGVLDTRGRVL